MNAILFPKYGSPDVLQLTEVEKPTPNENQVLVKIVAAAANPLSRNVTRPRQGDH